MSALRNFRLDTTATRRLSVAALAVVPAAPFQCPRRRHASAWKRCGVSALDHGRREALVALSVPAGTHGDLDSTQHDFLRLVADWVAEHLPSARPAATNAGQEVEAVGRDALGGAAWQR
ncbi:hypothetical protein [Streptomyces antimycoticus]|uniref:hypothetical protein n=1 Tax=Streptomyces antimycoticus TaxID=68175 RepID=UPI001181521F|nr:hypothetical protein [Streptomyces antimycoticus]